MTPPWPFSSLSTRLFFMSVSLRGSGLTRTRGQLSPAAKTVIFCHFTLTLTLTLTLNLTLNLNMQTLTVFCTWAELSPGPS